MLPLKQVAYIKASNAEAYDHFACGGGNQGHSGNSIALSGDGSTMAVGRAVRERRRRRHQRQPARQLRLCVGSRLRVHPPGRHVGAAGVRQGVQPGTERSFRLVGRAEPRRQHDGGCRPLGIERRRRASTATRTTTRSRRRALSTSSRAPARPGRSRPTSRRRTRERAGEGDSSRRRRPVRLLDRTERRRQHAGGRRHQRGQRRATDQREPGRRLAAVCRRGLRLRANGGARGRSRPTSRAPTWRPATVRVRGRAQLRRQHAGRQPLSTSAARQGRSIRPNDNGSHGFRRAATSSRGSSARGASRRTSKARRAKPPTSFGFAVAISDDGNTIALGRGRRGLPHAGHRSRRGATTTRRRCGARTSGSARRTCSCGTAPRGAEQAFIKAPNPRPYNSFGVKLGLSGDGNTLAVASYLEDNGGRGIRPADGPAVPDRRIS